MIDREEREKRRREEGDDEKRCWSRDRDNRDGETVSERRATKKMIGVRREEELERKDTHVEKGWDDLGVEMEKR